MNTCARRQVGAALRPSRRKASGTLGAVMVLLAACGGGAPPPASAPGAAAPATVPASGAAAAPAATARPAPLKMVVSWSQPGGGQMGVWMPYETGLFAEQGLDVELAHVSNTSRIIQAMVAGEIHMAPLDPAASIQADLGGADIALYFAALNRMVFSVMTEPSITDPQQLRGKTIGITRIGSSTHSALLLALDRWGLEPDRDVALRQLGDVTAVLVGLEARQTDAGVISPPRTAIARREGYRELIDLGRDGPEYPSLAMGGSRAWVAAHDEAMRRFARAYWLGLERFKQDKVKSIEVFHKYLDTDDPALLDEMYAEFSQLMPNPPYIPESGMVRLVTEMAADEPRLAGHQPTEWVDDRYMRELDTSGFAGS
jgi:NitT/TauT family transport system substrate-binding protein